MSETTTTNDSNDESRERREAVGPEPSLPPTQDMAQVPETANAQTAAPPREVERTEAAPVMRAPASANAGAPAPGLGSGTAPHGSFTPHRPSGSGYGGGRSYGQRREGGRGERTYGRRRVCGFCMDNVQYIDYKDTARLRRFLSERGKIEPRRKTGTCAKHQRWLTTALKRARQMALLPYTAEHIRFMGR